MIERSSYALNAVQLENAVQALQKAVETFRPSPSEERLYRAFGIFVRVAVATFAGAVLASFLAIILPNVGEGFSLRIVFDVLIVVMGFLFVSAAIGATLFLLLNLRVVVRAFRQRRLLKKLGIREVSMSAWRLQRRGHRWSRLAGGVLTWGGILTLVFGLLGLIYAWSGRAHTIFWVVFGSFFAFGFTVLVWRFVQRSREQWAIVGDANRLRSELESHIKAGAGETVAVPAAVLEDVARIERVQIARERRDAVVASAEATNRGYGVLVARDLSLQKALLGPQQRVAVEDLIDNLSANPRPTGVESTAEGLLSARTPEGGVELRYTVDEGARRVHIVALTTHDHG
jgi:hypothetical protein